VTRRRGTQVLGLVTALAVVLAGCGGRGATPTGAPPTATESPAGTPAEKFTIGVSLASPTIPLYVAMAQGIRDKAAELGVEVVFTEANEDAVQQLNDVQDLIAQGVDGILISPIDAEAAIPAYEDARAAGIAIFSIARNTDPEVEDGFIGAPWGKFGEQIAAWTCEAAGGEGKIAMLKGPAGASFVEDMAAAYKEYMGGQCSGMQIVFENNNVPLTADNGLKSAQDALAANPDLKVIYANNDDLATGAIQALEEQGVAMDQVLVTGFDGTPEGVELVKEGKLDYTIALRPYHWGQLGLETIVRHLRGESLPHLTEIETIPLEAGTVEQYTEDDLR
jgi:ribose transport system substrate-binding protein